MKKLIIKYSAIALILLNVGCNQSEYVKTEDTPNSGWIEYDLSNLEQSINFDDDEIILPIKLTTSTNLNGIEIGYNISLVEGNVDENILGNKTVFIEKFEENTEIKFTPVYSDTFYTLKFTLVSTNDNNFQVGLSDDSKPTEFVLTVTNYKLYDATGNAPLVDANPFPAYVTKVGKIDDTHTSVESLWGPNFVAWATNNTSYEGQYLNKGTLVIDTTDNSITVTGDFVDTTGSSGSYDPVSGVYTFTFLQANLFGSGFEVNTTLTPQ